MAAAAAAVGMCLCRLGVVAAPAVLGLMQEMAELLSQTHRSVSPERPTQVEYLAMVLCWGLTVVVVWVGVLVKPGRQVKMAKRSRAARAARPARRSTA